MASTEITIDLEEIQALIQADNGLAQLLERCYNAVLDAEMTEHLQAAPDERTPARQGYRNGHRSRQLTTRVGTLELEVPRDRDGTFSSELFARYQRSEKALVTTLMEMVVQGVSTRKVKRVTTELCGTRFTKSTVSRLTQQLDTQVETWGTRTLEDDYPFLVLDAMRVKVRRNHAIRSATVLLAIGIRADGIRELLGLWCCSGETESCYADFLATLTERGLTGVEVVTSDNHTGLRNAVQATFPGVIWQRCQAHFRRNVLDKTPAEYSERMQAVLDTILEAPSPVEARAAFDAAAAEVEAHAAAAYRTLEAGWEDATAVLSLPMKYRRRLRTTNMLERFIEEIRRRERVIRIFPNRQSCWRLIGALCAEQHETWATGRRYFDMDAYWKWKQEPTTEEQPQPAAA